MDQRKVQIGLRIGLAVIAVTALIGAGIGLAQLPVPATEPGGEATEADSSSFDSYLDGGIVVPENMLNASGEPFVYPDGIAPDDNPVEGVARTTGTNATTQTYHYYQVSGATLRGRNSTTEFAYDGLGCTHVTGGSELILNTELPIPDGATIKYLRLYYYDTSNTNRVRGFITRYSPGTQTVDLVSATSPVPLPTPPAPPAGYGFVVSPELTEVVNNTTYVYTLIGWPDTTGSTLRICGLRVAYYPPPFGAAFLPVIR